MTRIKSAEKKGREEWVTEKAIKVAENLLKMGLNVEQIAVVAELSEEKVIELKNKYQN